MMDEISSEDLNLMSEKKCHEVDRPQSILLPQTKVKNADSFDAFSFTDNVSKTSSNAGETSNLGANNISSYQPASYCITSQIRRELEMNRSYKKQEKVWTNRGLSIDKKSHSKDANNNAFDMKNLRNALPSEHKNFTIADSRDILSKALQLRAERQAYIVIGNRLSSAATASPAFNSSKVVFAPPPGKLARDYCVFSRKNASDVSERRNAVKKNTSQAATSKMSLDGSDDHESEIYVMKRIMSAAENVETAHDRPQLIGRPRNDAELLRFKILKTNKQLVELKRLLLLNSRRSASADKKSKHETIEAVYKANQLILRMHKDSLHLLRANNRSTGEEEAVSE